MLRTPRRAPAREGVKVAECRVGAALGDGEAEGVAVAVGVNAVEGLVVAGGVALTPEASPAGVVVVVAMVGV